MPIKNIFICIIVLNLLLGCKSVQLTDLQKKYNVIVQLNHDYYSFNDDYYINNELINLNYVIKSLDIVDITITSNNQLISKGSVKYNYDKESKQQVSTYDVSYYQNNITGEIKASYESLEESILAVYVVDFKLNNENVYGKFVKNKKGNYNFNLTFEDINIKGTRNRENNGYVSEFYFGENVIKGGESNEFAYYNSVLNEQEFFIFMTLMNHIYLENSSKE